MPKVKIRNGALSYLDQGGGLDGLHQLVLKDVPIVLKVIWGCFMLACLIIMVKQVYQLCRSFYDEQTITDVHPVRSDPQFNWLTVCFEADQFVDTLTDFYNIRPEMISNTSFITNFWQFAGYDATAGFYMAGKYAALKSGQADLNKGTDVFKHKTTTQLAKDVLRREGSFRSHWDQFSRFYFVEHTLDTESHSILYFCTQSKNNEKSSQKTDFASRFFFKSRDKAMNVFSTPLTPVSSFFSPQSLAKTTLQSVPVAIGHKTHDVYVKISAKKQYNYANLRRRPCTVSTELFPVAYEVATGPDLCVEQCRRLNVESKFGCSFKSEKKTDALECNWLTIIDELMSSNPRFSTLMKNYDKFSRAVYDFLKDEVYRMDSCKEKCSTYQLCTEWDFQFNVVEDIHNGASSTIRSDAALLTININQFDVPTVEIFTEQKDKNIEELIGEVGGIIGLYFGLSIVTIGHLLFFCISKSFLCCKERRSDKLNEHEMQNDKSDE